MQEISVRDFQLKASKYLDSTPLVLTRYNKPIAVVMDYEWLSGRSKRKEQENGS